MDLRFVPNVFGLSVFIVGFRPLVRRVGAHVNLWFIGWFFLLLHYLTLSVSPSGATSRHVTELLALWALELCGLAFMAAAASGQVYHVGIRIAAELGVPVLLQTALSTCGVEQRAVHLLASLLFFAPAVHLLLRKRDRALPMVVISAAFAVLGLAGLASPSSSATLITNGALMLIFLGAAYLYALTARHFTRGVIAGIVGLAAWGLTFPLIVLMARFTPALHPERLLELPQYLVIAGIVLQLLEDHVLSTERMAMHDPLTDLPNRRLFEERLIVTMEEAKLQRTTIACLVIDIDNFKTINDTLGHEAGDQLLRALAVRLSWHMSPRDILARTGGDEFTALLAGVRDEHHLRFIAGAMMSAASVPVLIHGKPVDVRISIGIALSPDHSDDIDELRRLADEAMYRAKRKGGSLLAFAGEQ